MTFGGGKRGGDEDSEKDSPWGMLFPGRAVETGHSRERGTPGTGRIKLNGEGVVLQNK